jgi:hypothetical protein
MSKENERSYSTNSTPGPRMVYPQSQLGVAIPLSMTEAQQILRASAPEQWSKMLRLIQGRNITTSEIWYVLDDLKQKVGQLAT